MFDVMNLKEQNYIKPGVHLSYNREKGIVNLSEERPSFGEEWHTYDKLFFEHSDTCPSRLYRKRTEAGLPVQPFTQSVKMAVCCYILDKNKNLLITKRPDHLKIFPNVWVLPGGMVDFQE